MGGETRPEEARLQRRAHPQGRNGMKHPAERGCARRDGPQAEAPATPADEGRPTNRRRRVTERGDHIRAMRSSPAGRDPQSYAFGGTGPRSRPRARSRTAKPRCTAPPGANKNAPLQADGQRGGVRAGLWASRRRATTAQECSRGTKRRATPGGSAAPSECAHQIPRSFRIAAVREAPDSARHERIEISSRGS